ncbi:hypothetical protein G6011_01442 [Alternaria panax]|uniref:BTB domain-containing protein n=1 Tax=Alternaria panax TaxID=48097 RepID=A0AAD4IL08_9PLEO|nr:hypothetical protein G6011_01442 [Alternaria panax]
MDSFISLPTCMAAPTFQIKPPQLQRETASFRQQQVDPRNACDLLRKVFKKGWDPLPTAQKLHTDTPIGRGFNLITAAGVEFQVHSIMLIGGSKALQEGLFPGGDEPKSAKFLYTSDYKFLPGSEGDQLKQSTFEFYHATLIPNKLSPSPATIALVDTIEYAYHLHIYALAEELDYETLKSAAHAKLTIFAPFGTAERICKDENGSLQQLVVAAVLAQEARHWTDVQLTKFTSSIQGSEYEDFRKIYTVVKEETGELIKQASIAKRLVAEHKKGRDRKKAANSRRGNDDKNKVFGNNGSPMGNLGARPMSQKDKFKRRHEGKRAVDAVAKADMDGDMNMEVD